MYGSQIHPECPYWNAWGMITVLYNDYFVRSQVTLQGFKQHTIRTDPYWYINKDLKIEKTKYNEKVYDKLVRQLKVIKYLCQIEDFYGNSTETVNLIDQLHSEWKNEKSQDENKEKKDEKENDELNNDENSNENENKSQGSDEKQNIKPKKKSRFRKRCKRKGKDGKSTLCYWCYGDVESIVRYKMCKCGVAYCSKCWNSIFFDDDTIQCYKCEHG